MEREMGLIVYVAKQTRCRGKRLPQRCYDAINSAGQMETEGT